MQSAEMSNKPAGNKGLDVAVIGIAGRFPDAQNYHEFWNNLVNGKESFLFYSDEELRALGVDDTMLKNPLYVKTGGAPYTGKEYFDAGFFRYTPAEAELMDPQIRIFHELIWNLFEDAGYVPEKYEGKIGLYAGATLSLWDALIHLSGISPEYSSFAKSILSNRDYLATRISHAFSLRGPSYMLHTACSTSLVAIHCACRAILMRECNMAIAGGISVDAFSREGYTYQEGMITSRDGKCFAFDADSSGTAAGEGGAVVLLKRLEDALKDNDYIYAVVKGTAINNDGGNKVGFTAPSVKGQMDVILSAHTLARVPSDSITYIEAHGTGTELGDPIEVEALKLAFNTDKRGYCGLGSVKTNIGHLDVAAGIAGFVKTTLALRNKQIPPSLNFRKPNPKIDFENSPFYVNTQLKEWANGQYPRRAGISSFGIGGTNAHIVLEEAPAIVHTESKGYNLLVLSAKTETALEKMSDNLLGWLRENRDQNFGDICYTLQTGRKEFAYRQKIVCSSVSEAIDLLSDRGNKKIETSFVKAQRTRVVFLFPGQGAQYVNMARDMYESNPVFREEMDNCFGNLPADLCASIKATLFPSSESETETASRAISETSVTQVVLFIVEYSFARMLMRNSVEPYAMIGHSIGEYAAACIAGVFTLKDALHLVSVRGKLMQDMPRGSMLSINIDESRLRTILPSGLSIAAINSSSLCVIAGRTEAIEQFTAVLDEKGINYQRLHTSHAFHSDMMDPVLENYRTEVSKIKLSTPALPYISNVTGTWITASQAMNPRYWSEHIRETVKFRQGLEEIMKEDNIVFCEIGPGKSLSIFAGQHASRREGHTCINFMRHPKENINDAAYFTDKLGQLWLSGVSLDWKTVFGSEGRCKIPLPGYPFERQRYWKLVDNFNAGKIRLSQNGLRPRLSGMLYAPVWQPGSADHSSVSSEAGSGMVFFLDGDGFGDLVAEQLTGCRIVKVRNGDTFSREGPDAYTISKTEYAHYEKLFSELAAEGFKPGRVVHLTGVSVKAKDALQEAKEAAYYSLLYLARAIGKEERFDQRIELSVITSDVQDVIGDETINPVKALVHGLSKVIPQEYYNIKCRTIDADITGKKKTDQALALRLAEELQHFPANHSVAYRRGRRWIEVYQQANLLRDAAAKAFEEGGVYVLIGGTGKVGSLLATTLLRDWNAHVIITGRSDTPAKGKWSQLQQLAGNDDRLSYYSAAAADKEKLKTIFRAARKKYGKINGIIHAADNAGEWLDSIGALTAEQCEKQFAAKLDGLPALASALKETKTEPDFCLVFSSVASYLGGIGFGAYAATNSFADAFIRLQNRSASFPWFTCNWDGERPEYLVEIIQRMITTGNIRQVITSADMNFQARIEKWINPENARPEKREEEQKNGKVYYNRPQLSEEYLAPRNKTEEKLAQIWQEFFALKKAGVRDDFFELGGDSLKAISILSIVHRELNIRIPVKDFLLNPVIENVAGLAGGLAEEKYEGISKAVAKDYYAVSPSQKRFYILQQINPGAVGYNMPMLLPLENGMEHSKLEAAFVSLIRRHEMLRTSFELVNDEPVQKIHQTVSFTLPKRTCRKADIEKIYAALISPFDPGSAPLLRAVYLDVEDGDDCLFVDMHHIVTDGVSHNIFLSELKALYRDEPLEELKLQYKDYSEWLNSKEEKQRISAQEKYWLDLFRDEVPVLDLPCDFQRPAQQSFDGACVSFSLNSEEFRAIQEMCRAEQATVYMSLLAVINIWLSRLTGQDDIVVGSPVAARVHADLDRIIGLFVNTLAMRNHPEREKSCRQFLQEIKAQTLHAYDNQEYSFEELVEKVVKQRDMGRNPLFDVMFVLQNQSAPSESVKASDEIKYTHTTGQAKFDLRIDVQEGTESMLFHIEYSTRLFLPATIERFISCLRTLLKSMSHGLDKKIGELDILGEEEKVQLLEGFNNTAAAYPSDETVYTLFAKKAAAMPAAEALVCGAQRLTYSEVDRLSSRVAELLVKQGVKRGDIVALMLERSVEMMTGILGVLKAGAAYLPIATDYPQERRDFIFSDSGARFVLVNKAYEAPAAVTFLDIREEMLPAGITGEDFSPVKAEASGLAYVIYTSGSTGLPKGAMIEHGALVNRLHWMQKAYPLVPGDSILQKTPYTFDVSVWELLLWGITGAKLVMLEPGGEKYPDQIISAIEREKITMLHFVPSMLKIFLGYISGTDKVPELRSLKRVVCSGEALGKTEADQFTGLLTTTNGTALSNLYGPTEATIDVSYYECTPPSYGETIPIGKPIDNIRLYILDPFLQPQPVGVTGELYIAGVGLGRGYLNNPSLTESRFVANPFTKGGRMYRTGDLARWQPDGNIDYLGRIDDQVKLRGFRIELGEIESLLKTYTGIRDAVVAVRGNNEDKFLCAYYVSEQETAPADLQAYLSAKLPAYMVPAFYMNIPVIPLSRNGKADRKALPEFEFQGSSEYVAPQNDIQSRIIGVWAEVLGIDKDKIGVSNNFFELGGNSLKIIRLAKQMSEALQREVSVISLFKYPNIKSFCDFFFNQHTQEAPQEESVQANEIEDIMNVFKDL